MGERNNRGKTRNRLKGYTRDWRIGFGYDWRLIEVTGDRLKLLDEI